MKIIIRVKKTPKYKGKMLAKNIETQIDNSKTNTMDDKYTEDILIERYNDYKISYLKVSELNKRGFPIRQQNPPEDITENIAKFIIRNYDDDVDCMWAKGIKNRNNKLVSCGDLYSPKYVGKSQPEVKSFTSDGPSQFGPDKKFGVLYFLDLRQWLDDRIVLWRVNLTHDSPEFRNIKMNKTQTLSEQCDEGRRPHIAWEKMYPQIQEHCVKVYDGNFQNIFVKSVSNHVPTTIVEQDVPQSV